MKRSNLGQEILIYNSVFGAVLVNFDYQPDERKHNGTREETTINHVTDRDGKVTQGESMTEYEREQIIEDMSEEKNRVG